MVATIYQLPTQLAGTPGVYPNFKYMVTGDNVGTMTAAGYLNSVNLEAAPVNPTDVIQALYSFNKNTGQGTYGVFTVTITNGVITLAHQGGSGEVVLPTIVNHIATYTNTDGTISEDPATAISGGHIQAGLTTGTAGTLYSCAPTTATGRFGLTAVSSNGAFDVLISNASHAQASTYSIPDCGNTAGRLLTGATATPFTNGNFPKNSGTGGLMVDSGVPVSSLLSTTVVNTFTGNGQIILAKINGAESGNAVTANGNAGFITTSSLSTAGGATYVITWTNSYITTTSVILLSVMGGTNTVQNTKFTVTAGAGTSTLTIYNNTAATSLNGTIVIGYVVL